MLELQLLILYQKNITRRDIAHNASVMLFMGNEAFQVPY